MDLTIRTAALAREMRTAAKAAHILTSLIFFPIGQHGQPTNLDSFYKQLETWTTTHAREGQHQGQQHGMKKLELLDKQLITISTR